MKLIVVDVEHTWDELRRGEMVAVEGGRESTRKLSHILWLGSLQFPSFPLAVSEWNLFLTPRSENPLQT